MLEKCLKIGPSHFTMSSYLIQFLKLSRNQNGIKQEAKYLFEN